jgi:hypothetical protein
MLGRRVPYHRYVATVRGSNHGRVPNRPCERRPRILSHIVPREDDQVAIAGAVSIQARHGMLSVE